jgi:hypothetical protein
MQSWQSIGILLMLIFCIAIFHYYKTERFKAKCDEQTCQLDDYYINMIKYYISQICPSLNNLEIYSGEESVTVDKNVIYICLRDKNTNKYYSMNILMYVALHELAHKISKSYSKDHNAEFQFNFDKLLNMAYNKQIMTKPVFIPSDYCKKYEL